MAYNNEHKKVQGKFLAFIEREMSITLLIWLIIFLIAAIMEIID
jgi:hypothetical protein